MGIGLSDLWAASGLESPEFAGEEVRSQALALKHNNVHDLWAASVLENQESAGEEVRRQALALKHNNVQDLWAASGLESPEFAGEEVRRQALALKHDNVHDLWAASGLENQEFAGEEVRSQSLSPECQHNEGSNGWVFTETCFGYALYLFCTLSSLETSACSFLHTPHGASFPPLERREMTGHIFTT